MNSIEMWNKVVKFFNEHNRDEEYKLQELWIKIFEQYLHYNSLENEISSKREIHLGSGKRLIPDIVLRKGDCDFAIVELKQSCLISCDNYRYQLFSYLKQLKLTIGILITNKIELFVYDYSKDDNEQQFVEIDFKVDNGLGERFVDLFKKENAEISAVRDFVKENCDIKNEVKKLESITDENLVKDVLGSYFKSEGYQEIAINNFMSNLKVNVNVNKKEELKPIIKEMESSKRNFIPRNNSNNLGYGNHGKIGKGDAIRICGEHGIAFSNNYITFANLGGVNGKYGANVRLEYLKNEWTILLNDGYSKELHILQIPANTFVQSDFYIRRDKNLIVLGIDKSFEDCHPQQGITNKFFEYKIDTIDTTDYENR